MAFQYLVMSKLKQRHIIHREHRSSTVDTYADCVQIARMHMISNVIYYCSVPHNIHIPITCIKFSSFESIQVMNQCRKFEYFFLETTMFSNKCFCIWDPTDWTLKWLNYIC